MASKFAGTLEQTKANNNTIMAAAKLKNAGMQRGNVTNFVVEWFKAEVALAVALGDQEAMKGLQGMTLDILRSEIARIVLEDSNEPQASAGASPGNNAVAEQAAASAAAATGGQVVAEEPNTPPARSAPSSDGGPPPCPKCGGPTTRREGKYGPFWGCDNFKNGCRGLINIKAA